MAGVFERSEFPAITDFAGQAAARIRRKAISLAALQIASGKKDSQQKARTLKSAQSSEKRAYFR